MDGNYAFFCRDVNLPLGESVSAVPASQHWRQVVMYNVAMVGTLKINWAQDDVGAQGCTMPANNFPVTILLPPGATLWAFGVNSGQVLAVYATDIPAPTNPRLR
jgi:hypothetical protein